MPTSADNLVAEGRAALRAGDRQRAVSLLSQAVRHDARNEQAWLWLAGAVGDDAKRRACLERVLEIDPRNSAARRGLASLASASQLPAPRPLTVPEASFREPSTPLPSRPPILIGEVRELATPPPSRPPILIGEVREPPESRPNIPVPVALSERPATAQAAAPPASGSGGLFDRLLKQPVPQIPSADARPRGAAPAPRAAISVPTVATALPKSRSAAQSERLVWILVGVLGLILMLAGGGYALVVLLG